MRRRNALPRCCRRLPWLPRSSRQRRQPAANTTASTASTRRSLRTCRSPFPCSAFASTPPTSPGCTIARLPRRLRAPCVPAAASSSCCTAYRRLDRPPLTRPLCTSRCRLSTACAACTSGRQTTPLRDRPVRVRRPEHCDTSPPAGTPLPQAPPARAARRRRRLSVIFWRQVDLRRSCRWRCRCRPACRSCPNLSRGLPKSGARASPSGLSWTTTACRATRTARRRCA
mmetsp:Transcript_13233/g.41694  ORF Transcript_13233/g.41694 Transcript_13233/m.41694 type:complete len:228 (+) Transcript_13233:551-1234(+)